VFFTVLGGRVLGLRLGLAGREFGCQPASVRGRHLGIQSCGSGTAPDFGGIRRAVAMDCIGQEIRMKTGAATAGYVSSFEREFAKNICHGFASSLFLD